MWCRRLTDEAFCVSLVGLKQSLASLGLNAFCKAVMDRCRCHQCNPRVPVFQVAAAEEAPAEHPSAQTRPSQSPSIRWLIETHADWDVTFFKFEKAIDI